MRMRMRIRWDEMEFFVRNRKSKAEVVSDRERNF